ncbi:MAG: glycosyltransferase family 2 protein [Phycisphaerales bacterium]
MSGHADQTDRGGAGKPSGVGRPRVSVVTPSLDQARFLPLCLDSVTRQGGSVEHIVMDGGSTDGSVDILRARDGLRWESGPDGGQVRAINEGIRRSRGDYVMWLNADDELLDGALDALAATLDASPDADAVYARARMVDESGRLIRPYPTFNLGRDDLRRKCSICQPTVLIRRSALERVGLPNPALDICFDYELWLRLLSSGQMVFLDREVALTRQHGATKTSSRRLRALVEAGYLMRAHFGGATWRWSAKWVVHRWTLDHWRFVTPVVGWWSAVMSASRYHNRFDASRGSSAYARRLISALARPPRLPRRGGEGGERESTVVTRAVRPVRAGAS